ncbi:TlpA disulfide reductase family protein [Stenotrophomonas mori]|uniref:TlpA family protein disulfide reductase n=1 Tax=Stenotrophomonas mori TaxID=2871096 RepID=A0ABT0SD28_9GAMM|nr:TlpA disulfide reductase family protein [Stenotrophomonas mori]MCL7713228.1 TlpA family protein disulfide reductase [Stenotrophomonas mori]
MSVISAGPFPLMALLGLLAAFVAWLFARGLATPADGARSRVGAVVTDAFLLGVLGARLAHVLWHAGDYLPDPVSIIRLGDGGYSVAAGLAVAVAYAWWRTRRQAPRKPVMLGLAAGAALWAIGGMALFAVQRSTIALPDVVLHDLQGTAVPLSSRAGQPLVVNLWASWCGPCRREMPVLARAQAEHPQVGFVFANQGEDAAEIRLFLQEEQLTLGNILLDPESELMRQTGARALPTTLFFDADGRLRNAHMGELSRATLNARLRELQ